MKFLVSDRQDERHNLIRSYLMPSTAVIAAILATIDLEWTIRRVLDHAAKGKSGLFGTRPVSGLDGYAKAWERVFQGRTAATLQDVVEDWTRLEQAYWLRHDIVHGRKGTGGLSYVTNPDYASELRNHMTTVAQATRFT